MLPSCEWACFRHSKKSLMPSKNFPFSRHSYSQSSDKICILAFSKGAWKCLPALKVQFYIWNRNSRQREESIMKVGFLRAWSGWKIDCWGNTTPFRQERKSCHGQMNVTTSFTRNRSVRDASSITLLVWLFKDDTNIPIYLYSLPSICIKPNHPHEGIVPWVKLHTSISLKMTRSKILKRNKLKR